MKLNASPKTQMFDRKSLPIFSGEVFDSEMFCFCFRNRKNKIKTRFHYDPLVENSAIRTEMAITAPDDASRVTRTTADGIVNGRLASDRGLKFTNE